jgi:hypothetical protein
MPRQRDVTAVQSCHGGIPESGDLTRLARGTKAARRIAMRIVILLALVGCETSGDVSIDNSTPLGAGLTARYDVTQIGCEAVCGNEVFPTALAVEVSSGPAKLGKVTPFDGTSAWFELTGTGTGTATIAITGDDHITSSFTIAIVPVTSTLVIDRRIDDATTLPDVASPAHALTESALRIAQRNVGPDGGPVLGEAQLSLDPGTSDARVRRRDGRHDRVQAGHREDLDPSERVASRGRLARARHRRYRCDRRLRAQHRLTDPVIARTRRRGPDRLADGRRRSADRRHRRDRTGRGFDRDRADHRVFRRRQPDRAHVRHRADRDRFDEVRPDLGQRHQDVRRRGRAVIT